MRKLLIILPLLVLAGCHHSTPLAGGGDVPGTAPGKPVPAPKSDFAALQSLSFHVTGGFAGMDNLLELQGNKLNYTSTRPPAPARSAELTPDELKQFKTVLERADFTHLVGDYRQEHLADGFNETLTVTTGAQHKTYTVTNTGDRAPAAYYDVTKYLRTLQETKFSPQK